MGFFSWRTQDTDRSIANRWSNRPAFRVVMQDDKGVQYVETDYDGYGVFGGKDYYGLLSEMNGGTGNRMHGIELAFGDDKDKLKWPSLTEHGGYLGYEPENCVDQGYFYSEDDDYVD